jgi:cysteine-rich repeat protein
MRSLGFGRFERPVWMLALLAASCTAAAAACGNNETASTGTGTGATGGSGGTTGTGATTAGGDTGGSGGGTPVCGDGVVTPPELCDDGNMINGDGCQNDCSFSCTKGTSQGDAKCDDKDPCNGVETCNDNHACVSGKAPDPGTSCGTGKVCKNGACGDITCGDGFVDPGEDCDDGNIDPADGCNNCKFTCTADADCKPADPCAGTGVCAANHTCSTKNPLADGAACPGGTCKAGACTVPSCGNGTVEAGEQCDDGNLVNGDGCNTDCKFSCANPATDCPAPLPCNKAVCTAAKTCSTAPDAAQNGAACGAGLTCNNGACLGAGAVCGNGVIEAGEDCDFGAANGPGTGCESICKFSCTKSPDSCPDQNACNGAEACADVVVNGQTGQKCSAGSALPACSSCGAGLCASGTCVAGKCGDGCVDMASGETCDPPNASDCDAACHIHVCGNGTRESGEQCDDGNTKSLDGCSAACRFEQIHRIRYLVLQYATDVLCPNNRLGAAVIGQTAQSQLQTNIDGGVANGAIDVLLQLLSLDDLTGTSDPMLQIGAMTGVPNKQGQPYDGTNDLDFWHTVDPTSVDASGTPLALVPAQISAKALTAGPGAFQLVASFGGGPAPLHLSNVKLAINIGSANAPLLSAGGVPPGHLASEHLDPALVSFATAGQTNANGAGKLCGDVSAASLAAIAVPDQLTMGAFACAEGYTLQNTMLDVIVGGCTVFGVQQIAPEQPDQVDPAAPAGGAGGPYTLAENASHAVSSCTDKNGAAVPVATCLNAAAYSSFFKIATDRVIAK